MNLPGRGGFGLFGRPMLVLGRALRSFWLLAFALTASALCAGAIHLPLLVGFALLVVVSSVILVTGERSSPHSPRWSRRDTTGAAIWWLLALYCLLQSVPLPASVLQELAPLNADIWARALRPFDGVERPWGSLSLAPGQTLIEALKLGTYGLIFGVCLQLSRQFGMTRFAAMAYGAAVAVALVTAAHRTVGAQQLYGFYTPLNANDVAPLLNANNRAGYLNLGFFCGLGLLLRAGPSPAAALVGLGSAFLAAEILLCASMGATGALGVGLLLLLMLPRRGARERRRPEFSRLAQAGVVLSIGLAATLMAGIAQRGVWLRLTDQSLEKLDLAVTSARLAADYFGLGIGRGAFGSVSPAYQPGNGDRIFEQAENFPLQWATEWGVPVALAALVTIGWVLAPTLRRSSLARPTHGCAVVGCLVLLLQNLVDLGLEVPAVAGMFCAIIGALSGRAHAISRVASEAERSRGRLSSARCLVAGAGLTTACAVLAASFGVPSTAWLRHELHAQLAGSRGAASPEFWNGLRKAVEAYPAESYFFSLGSAAALRSGQNPMIWISMALERNPTSARTHLQLGRILRSRGASSQSLGALKRAMELDPTQVGVVVDLVQSWQVPATALAQAAPEGLLGADFLALLATRTSDAAQRVELLENALQRAPSRLDLHQSLAVELLQDLGRADEGVLCAGQREACLARSAEHVRRAAESRTPAVGVLEARLLIARGEGQAAEQHLAEVCEQFPRDLGCAEARVSQAMANRSPRLSGAINSLIALACSSSARCGKAHLSLGNLFATTGQWLSAISHYRRAVQEAPSMATYAAMARAADQLGQGALAADARRRMEELRSAAAMSRTPAAAVDTLPEPTAAPPGNREPPAADGESLDD